MKTRFNYQVLYQQLQVAYKASDADEQFDTWTNKKCQDSCNVKYWHMGLKLILKYLMFVWAFRESNFNLYKRSLCSWLPWFFVFNYPNYQRSATTHFIDLHFVEKGRKC